MSLENIIELINSLGFPIFVCLILFWFISKILLKISSKLETLNDSILLLTEKIGSIKNV